MAKSLSYKYYTGRYLFYLHWYLSLQPKDLYSNIGSWILGNVKIYDGILKEIDASLGIFRPSRETPAAPPVDISF